jgi:hypothetical protein
VSEREYAKLLREASNSTRNFLRRWWEALMGAVGRAKGPPRSAVWCRKVCGTLDLLLLAP